MPLSTLWLALSLAALSFHRPSGPPPCVVARVVDGDTFYCRDGRKVRLIGVDSPEMAQGSPGRAAREGLRRMLHAGRTVRLELDLTPTDRYGRLLAWVWDGGTLVNEALVRQGWAMLYTVPPNVKYVERLTRAQKKARAERAGLWNGTTFDCPPSRFRRGECVGSEAGGQ